MPAREAQRIADQLKRSYDGPAWHGPALRELLSGVDEALADHRPEPKTHTIHELVLHIAAWLRIARERLSASAVRDHTEEENWPAPISWSDAQGTLEHEQRALEQAVLAFPDHRLDERAPASEPQTFYILLHGVVQHSLYHAGQIAILKKNSI